MNEKFRVTEDGTLVEYLGNQRSFDVFKGEDLISRIMSYYRKNITEVTVPGMVKAIEYKAFRGCRDLRKVILSPGVRAVRFGAFWDTSVEEIVVPHTVRHFDDNGVPVNKTVTLHTDYVRGAYQRLKKADFILKRLNQAEFDAHAGLYIAMKKAYRRQISLHLHIRDELTDHEFEGMPFDCTLCFHSASIKSNYLLQRAMPQKVIIEEGVLDIDPEAFTSSGDPFFEGSNISQIIVAKENCNFYDIDGVLFSSDHRLLRFPDGKLETEYHIPASTKAVAAGAFSGSGIETLYVPKGTFLENNSLACMWKLDQVYKEV